MHNTLYVPQLDSILPTAYPAVVSQSRNGRYIASFVVDPDRPVRLFVNGVELELDREYGLINYTSWSPDESRLAISVNGVGGDHEVWIVDVERWLRDPSQPVPMTSINLHKRYCKLSRWGVNAEFLTNTTLAVSIHALGDEGSYLWEVRDDGTLLRQLTSR